MPKPEKTYYLLDPITGHALVQKLLNVHEALTLETYFRKNNPGIRIEWYRIKAEDCETFQACLDRRVERKKQKQERSLCRAQARRRWIEREEREIQERKARHRQQKKHLAQDDGIERFP